MSAPTDPHLIRTTDPTLVDTSRTASFRRILRSATESKALMIGLALILIWVIVATFAPWIAPYRPNAQHMTAATNLLPSADHWLGADPLRRDILSRIIWGARRVLTIAPIALVVSYAIGISIGLLAGYYGGWVDEVCSRLIDVLLSFPKIVLYVVLLTSLGPSAINIVVAVILISSPGIGRLVRGLTLELRTRDFVAAARTRGENGIYIMLIEILPNARGALIVDFCMRMGYTIIAIGVLGFLGLGLPPPHPDWGGMVREGTPMMVAFPHMSLIPAFAIITLVMGFNLVADGLQELSDDRR